MQRYGGNLTHAQTVDIRAFPHPLLGTGNQHERARPTRKLHEPGKQKYPCAESAAIYQALFRAGYSNYIAICGAACRACGIEDRIVQFVLRGTTQKTGVRFLLYVQSS